MGDQHEEFAHDREVSRSVKDSQDCVIDLASARINNSPHTGELAFVTVRRPKSSEPWKCVALGEVFLEVDLVFVRPTSEGLVLGHNNLPPSRYRLRRQRMRRDFALQESFATIYVVAPPNHPLSNRFGRPESTKQGQARYPLVACAGRRVTIGSQQGERISDGDRVPFVGGNDHEIV